MAELAAVNKGIADLQPLRPALKVALEQASQLMVRLARAHGVLTWFRVRKYFREFPDPLEHVMGTLNTKPSA